MRKLLSIGICCILILGLSALPVSATDKSQEAEAKATLEYGNEVTKLTENDLIGGTMFTQPGTLTLLSDLTVTMKTETDSDAGGTIVIGWAVNGPNIDLNGHTLTFECPENISNCVYLTAIQGTGNTCDIQNGTIIVKNVPAKSDDSNSFVLPYAVIGFVQGKGAKFSNLELLVEGNNALDAGVSFTEGSANLGTLLTLENCIIDVGKSSTAVTAPYPYSSDNKIIVESGSYTGLTLTTESSETGTTSVPVSLAGSSNKLTTNPTSVADGTAIITSAATTAIIVQNGRAYTYDTLQDAVNAAAKRATTDEGESNKPAVTIHMVKQPTEEKILLPDDTPDITLTALGSDNSINIQNIELTTSSGATIKPDTSGKVEIIAVSSVTISGGTSVEVGRTMQLSAIVAPDNATDKTVIWSSSDQNIATVNENGLVTGVASGTATITAKAGEQSATCTVTVKTRSSSGSSNPSYAVTTPSQTENGTVSVTPKSAKKGATVTLTVTPDEGYQLDKLTVTDAKGNVLALTDRGDGKYTFVMPASKVAIEATFVETEAPIIPPTFTDVPADAYYADAVKWAVDQGITTGATSTTFEPNASCTRAQVVTFLWRAAGSPKAAGADPFTDLDPSAYYHEAVLWAVEQGVTLGTSPTTFSPDQVVSRAQVVTFLHRYENTPAGGGDTPFTDVAGGSYYADAVQWAVDQGITTGTTPTTFSPEDDCTRGQIVTFLYRALAQ